MAEGRSKEKQEWFEREVLMKWWSQQEIADIKLTALSIKVITDRTAG